MDSSFCYTQNKSTISNGLDTVIIDAESKWEPLFYMEFHCTPSPMFTPITRVLPRKCNGTGHVVYPGVDIKITTVMIYTLDLRGYRYFVGFVDCTGRVPSVKYQ